MFVILPQMICYLVVCW